jgi:hypothetical protein
MLLHHAPTAGCAVYSQPKASKALCTFSHTDRSIICSRFHQLYHVLHLAKSLRDLCLTSNLRKGIYIRIEGTYDRYNAPVGYPLYSLSWYLCALPCWKTIELDHLIISQDLALAPPQRSAIATPEVSPVYFGLFYFNNFWLQRAFLVRLETSMVIFLLLI